MVRPTLLSLVALFFAGAAAAACEQGDLIQPALHYDQLIRFGNPSYFTSIYPSVLYKENDKPTNISASVAANGLDVSATRTFYDPTLCKFWAEHVVAYAEHPYILAAQVYVSVSNTTSPSIEIVDLVVTQQNDFFFNATAYQELVYESDQNWYEIDEDKRDSREVLQAAGDAYFAHLHDRSPFPAGVPCTIVAGGMNPGRGNGTTDECTHKPKEPGVPTQTMTDRRYVIDETYGVLNIFTRFGGLDLGKPNASTSDSHTFRLEGGKIRSIHIATVCITPKCGFDKE